MGAAVVPASSTYGALCEEFITETSALCGALASENPAQLVDHMAKIFPADDLLPLIDELGGALAKTPPRPVFFEALREELSASSGDSAATTDGLRLDEAGLRAQECVRALAEAHYVDSSTLGIPRAELDADGELLLGKCRKCSATRLLASLAEHEADCQPAPAPSRQPPAAASLPAAAEGSLSIPQAISVGAPAPKKRTMQKNGPGRPQKRPRAESAPAGAGADAPGSLPPWAAQLPAKRLPPLHPGSATANAAQPASEVPVQHPFVPISSAPSARPKPIVKLKQPSAAKLSSPAAALNAAWANFPMPTDLMSEDFGSLPQSMDWLNSADLAVAPASAPAELGPSKAAAKLAAKASAKAGTAAAQKAAAKRAAKKKRALAAAPNPRMGLFQAFTHHPRKKRSASVKRKPRANLKSPAQQPGAFAEVIASLADDSPKPQPHHHPALRHWQRHSASQAGSGPRMRHPAAHAHASLNALSAIPSLSLPQPPWQDEQAAHVPAQPGQPAQAGQPGHPGQALQGHAGQPGQPGSKQQMTKPYIPQAVLQRAQAERSVEPIKAYLRHQQLLRQQLMQQQANSLQRDASSQREYPASSRPPASLLNGQAHSSQQLPAPAGSMIPVSSQPSAHRLSGPHVRVGATQGRQTPGASTYLQQPQQAHSQHSAPQQETLRAMYMQRTGQPYQASNMAVSQAGSPLRRNSLQHPCSGVPMPAQSNPLSAVTSAQGYRHSSPQPGSFGCLSANLGSPVSSSQYMQPGPAVSRVTTSQGQIGSGAAHAGQPAVSFGQQSGQPAAQPGQPVVSFEQQRPASQPQHFFTSQQQPGGTPQYSQHLSGLPAYLSNNSGSQNGVLGLPNGVNPLKGSRLGHLPQPEASQSMRWIPTSISPPTDKLASMQQLNPIPGARPEDPVQPLLGRFKFQY